MKYKLLLLFITTTLFYFLAIAQTGTAKITGTITDIKGKPIAGATVILTAVNDTAITKTISANDDGKFVFKTIATGQYVINVSAIGYNGYISSPFTMDEKHILIQLPTIVLQPTGQHVLKDVVVTTKKPLVEHKIDRTIINVDAMISAAGGNALDVLTKSPGVMVDVNGGISLYGVSGVLVLIDDRPAYMSAQDLAAYLRSLPGGMIDKIELMSNPPAKYDAAGNAIINIVLKKNRSAGFNGSISLGYNQGVYGRSNDALNLNYRIKKINIFSNVSYGHERNYNDGNINRYFYNTDGSATSTLLMNIQYKYLSNSGFMRAGMDYFASPKTTIGILVTGGIRPGTDRRDYTSSQYDSNMKLDSLASGYTNGTYRWKNAAVNVNMLHKFDSTGKQLTADLDYINYNSYGSQISPSYVYQPNGSLVSSNEILNILPSNINIWSAKADYTQPLTSGARLDAGLKSSYVVTDNSTSWFNQVGSVAIPDYSNSNHFIYRENINALYVSATKEWKRWAIQGGLRAENTQANGHQIGNGAVPDSSFKKNYTIIFPTFYILYKFDDKGDNTLKFSYGLRVRRPNYQQLNPFLSYVDKYTYTAGNPYLNPHENNVFNLEYSYKNYFGVSFAYLYVKNDMYNLTEVEDGIFIIRPENFGVNYSFNLRPYISFSPIKRWHVDADLLLFHLVNKGNAYAQSINNSITTGEFEWNNQFQLKHGWSAELNGFFPGRMGGGQTFSDPVWRIDAGVQKTILKGNGTIRLAANDIFKTLKMRDKTTIPGEATAIHTSETDSRRVGIAFSYRFGKEANGRKRNHNSGGAEDEQGRAK